MHFQGAVDHESLVKSLSDSEWRQLQNILIECITAKCGPEVPAIGLAHKYMLKRIPNYGSPHIKAAPVPLNVQNLV